MATFALAGCQAGGLQPDTLKQLLNGTGVPALDDLVSAATVDTVLGEAKAVFGDSITGLTFTQQIGDSVIVDGPPMKVGPATCAAPTFVRDLRYGDTRNERGLVLHTVPCDSLHDGTVPLQLSSLSGSKLSAALKAGEASMGVSATTGLSVVKVVVSDGRPGVSLVGGGTGQLATVDLATEQVIG